MKQAEPMDSFHPRTLDDVVSERIRSVQNTFFPNLRIDCKDRPYHAGTITVMDIQGTRLMVTARHVLDRDQGNECDIGENQLRAAGIDGPVELHPFQLSILTTSDGKTLDLAILKANALDVKALAVEPISVSLVHQGELHDRLYLAACGFPSSKNSEWNWKVTCRPYSYHGLVASDSAVEKAGYDPRYYFAIEIDLKRVYRGKEKMVRAPDPSGISGGPVFVVHDFKDQTTHLPAFAGIVVARDSEKKHLICVRASFVDVVAGARSP